MSRSYRRNPILQDGNRRRRWVKNQANRRVRRSKDIPNGNMYRKFYNKYRICDCWSRCTLSEWLAFGNACVPYYYYTWEGEKVINRHRDATIKMLHEFYTEINWKKRYYWK